MNQIPCIDFTQDPHSLEQGSEGWKDLCEQVRNASEQYGSFQAIYNKIPLKLCQDVFDECKPLFDLPREIKEKNTSSTPMYGYLGNSDLDMYRNFEGFGIADSPMIEPVQAFADIMWPNGNPSFCEAVHSISKHFHELEMIVMKMLCDTYGVAKHFKAQEGSTQDLFRVHKYKIPQERDSPVVLGEHRDKGNITIICQDGIQGLEVLSRKGEWCQVGPSKEAFTVVIAESLKAWSNGRLYSPLHKVTLGGQKERYSYTLFGLPKGGVIVDVPEEFIDEEHPRAYKPYTFMSFIEYLYINDGKDNVSIEVYAGV